MTNGIGDIYNLRIDSESPIRVRAVIANKGRQKIVKTVKTEMTVIDLQLVAIRRSSGEYSFREIKATVEPLT